MSLKRNIKVLSLALVAVFAFSVVAAGAAQANAPRWTTKLGGGAAVTLAAGAKKGFTASSTGVIKLGVPTLGLNLESKTNGDCTATGNLVGSGAGAPGTADAIKLTCKNVVTNNPLCKASSENENVHGLVATEELNATLVWLNETGDAEVGVLFTPVNAEDVFARVNITEPECPVANTYKVTGCVIAKATPVTSDVAEGKLEFPATAIKNYWTNQTPTRTKDECTGLKFGENKATFTGIFDLKPTEAGLTIGIEPG